LASGLTSGLLLTASDLGVQYGMKGEDDKIDWRRTFSMFSWGLLWYGGPQQYLWTVAYPRFIGQGTTMQAGLKVSLIASSTR
jgi:hypothetical protein